MRTRGEESGQTQEVDLADKGGPPLGLTPQGAVEQSPSSFFFYETIHFFVWTQIYLRLGAAGSASDTIRRLAAARGTTRDDWSLGTSTL